MTTHEMQVRYFELRRKQDFFALHYVPTAAEVDGLYKRQERNHRGEMEWYPGFSKRVCPDPKDQAELKRLERAIAAAGVQMFH